ncbi:MAG: hypothetical protein ACM3TU_02190 [Bacillota bacterium]
MMYPPSSLRGVTLLIAVILSSVVLTVALALLDISYKQVILASSAKQSHIAFYSADSAMECALYWDQQKNAFSYTASSYVTSSSGFSCADQNGNEQTIVISPPSYSGNASNVSGSTRTTIFSIPCTGGGNQAKVQVNKQSNGTTDIFATGYSTCSLTDPRRIERGLKIHYDGS